MTTPPPSTTAPWIGANQVHLHSDVGGRANNEDLCDYLISPDGSALLVVLADGMGGHASGEVASAVAVQVTLEVFRQNGFEKPSEFLAFAMERAHETIREQGSQNRAYAGMGSTIVAVVVQPGRITVGHVGDSRALQFAAGHVRRLTQDHLFVCDSLGVPENKAKHHPQGNVLSQALGHDGPIKPAVAAFDARPGDLVVLCSDGVSEYVSEAQMFGLAELPSLERIAVSMVEAALKAGTKDNSTVAAIRIP